MRIGVVRYPGSNCFNDTIRYFGKNNCRELWYKEEEVIKNQPFFFDNIFEIEFLTTLACCKTLVFQILFQCSADAKPSSSVAIPALLQIKSIFLYFL